jgi:prophage antirepressor-like protein
VTAVELFTFPITGQAVRTAELRGEPAVVANDVCAVLQHSNPRQAVAKLPERMKGVTEVDTPGGPQRMTVLTEAGVYRLVMRSNLPAAEAFQDWLAEEVLPALRRTGSYSVAPRHELPTSFAEALELAAKQARELEAAAPMVEQAKQHRAADGMTAVPDFANKVKAWASERGVKVLHKDVWDFLGEIGLLIRGNTIRHNHPTAEAVKRDFVRLKETTYESSSGAKTAASPRLTPAGEGWAWDRAVKRIESTGSLTRKAVSA